jgi:hypothetical protein
MADVKEGEWDFRDFHPPTLMPMRLSRFLFDIRGVEIIEKDDLYRKDFNLAQFGFSGVMRVFSGEWTSPSGKKYSSREEAIEDYLKEKRLFRNKAKKLYVIEAERNPNAHLLKQGRAVWRDM